MRLKTFAIKCIAVAAIILSSILRIVINIVDRIVKAIERMIQDE